MENRSLGLVKPSSHCLSAARVALETSVSIGVLPWQRDEEHSQSNGSCVRVCITLSRLCLPSLLSTSARETRGTKAAVCVL